MCLALVQYFARYMDENLADGVTSSMSVCFNCDTILFCGDVFWSVIASRSSSFMFFTFLRELVTIFLDLEFSVIV